MVSWTDIGYRKGNLSIEGMLKDDYSLPRRCVEMVRGYVECSGPRINAL